MSHDKIKAAARRRAAEKGEPYAAARREDIKEHKAAALLTSALSPEEVRAAAEAHRELGPEYSDAVVASFIDKVDREVAARVEARLAGTPERPPEPGRRVRRVARDLLAASAGALVIAGAFGVHEIASPQPGPPAKSASVAQRPNPALPAARAERVRAKVINQIEVVTVPSN